ncbi:Dbl homology domain-containing protein [Chytriomyces sp. MP71]|nr:Dbl homology domain-containing protein [Chytriomyces sp. MP71]
MMPSIILGNNSVAVDPMGLPIASSSRPPVPASGSIPVPGPRRKSNADNVAFPSSANLSSLSSLNTNTRKSSGGGVPGPFGGSGGFMTPTMNQSFVLPLPPNADRALANSTKPLFQRCIDLIAQLYPFPLFEFYLFPDGVDAYMIPAQDGSALPVIADPVDVLWNCFKLGAPLCVVYNEISKTTTGVFLNVDDVSGIRAPFYPTKPCKDNLYKFITACRSELHLVQAQELSGVSELYKDDTAGFMKFLKLVEELVHRIDQAGNMPIARSLPFSTELSKEITNPLDNKSRVIKELVETERAYIFSLEELQRYQNELGATKMFSKDMMQQLFSNLNELLDFQRRFMVGMESTLNLGVSEQRIGQLFVLNVSFILLLQCPGLRGLTGDFSSVETQEEAFEVYYPFCGNYQNASGFVLSHGDELKLMSHIIQPHSITAYLIKPLQRLMKYPLLLKELVKLTDPETYPYMDELKDGLESIKRVTERLNEVQRRDENERLKQDLIERMEDWKVSLLLFDSQPYSPPLKQHHLRAYISKISVIFCFAKSSPLPATTRNANTISFCLSVFSSAAKRTKNRARSAPATESAVTPAKKRFRTSRVDLTIMHTPNTRARGPTMPTSSISLPTTPSTTCRAVSTVP